MKTLFRPTLCFGFLTVVAVLSLGCIHSGVPPEYTKSSVVPNNTPGGDSAYTSPGEWPEFEDWTGESSPHDVAVIVGIEDYAFLPDVAGAVDSANDWERFFRESRGMDKVYVLTNQDAPKEEILRFVSDASREVSSKGRLWFVFVGHGAAHPKSGDGLLIGMDAQQSASSVVSRGLPRNEVLAALERGKQKETVVVLDSCFSGRGANGELLAKGTQPLVPVKESGRRESTTILSAAKNDQLAGQLPGLERPGFSYLLLGAMRGWAAGNDGQVEVREAMSFVARNFRYLKGRSQTPVLEGQQGLVLAAGVSEESPMVRDLIRGVESDAPVRPNIVPSPPSTAAPPSTPAPTTSMLQVGALAFPKPDGWSRGPLQQDAAQIALRSDAHSAHQITIARTTGKPRSYSPPGEPVERPSAKMINGIKVITAEVTSEVSPGTHAHTRVATVVHDGFTYLFILVTSRPTREADVRAFDQMVRGIRPSR